MSDSPGEGKRNLFVIPTFYKPLSDLATSQGECLVLECRVKGVPPPKIKWKREGDVVEDSPDFRMLQRGEVTTLVIGEAFPEDTGVFTCEATNKAGTATTSCKVVVKGGGAPSILTKSAASSQVLPHQRPTQVLPTQQVSSCTELEDTHLRHQSQSQQAHHSHISQYHLTPKKQQVNGDKETGSSSLASDSEAVESSFAVVKSLQNNSSERSNTSSISSTIMTTAAFSSPSTGTDENHNFKEEKDQLIKAVAQSFSAPKQNKQKKVSRELAIIARDIELREAEAIPLPGDDIDKQEYKVSAFDQRLMNEIEYRLESMPPINEDPEDGVFENIPESEKVAPTFVSILKNFKAMDGTSTKFTCRVTAKPAAKVFWFKDGKQISKRSQHYLQRSDGEGGHELYIPQLHMDDDGNYTALATNPQGRKSSTGRLAMVSDKHNSFANDITSPTPAIARQSLTNPRMMSPLSPNVRMTSPQTTLHGTVSVPLTSPTSATCRTLPEKGQLADDEECPVDKYYRPTFIQKPPEDTKAVEGKLVRFDVKVTGLPLPDLEWLINGRPVRQDVLHKILVRENNVHSLLFERVSPMDEGQYTIRATNKAGTAVAHIQLHVTPREHMNPPAFIQRLTGHCVAEGDAVRLEARVVAAPRAMISWKRGSEQVIHDSRTQLYEDESGYVCLQITQARLSDAAWYTCSATNKAGISSCNCKLDVYSRASEAPSSKRRIRTPHRYANLAKVAGVDMREALTPDAQPHHMLPESEEL